MDREGTEILEQPEESLQTQTWTTADDTENEYISPVIPADGSREQELLECSVYTGDLINRGSELLDKTVNSSTVPQEVQPSVCANVVFDEINCKLVFMEEYISRLSANIAEKEKKDEEVLRNYKASLDSLKVSLAANQRNEEKIYKELEATRKDEKFSTIRPFLEFIIERHLYLVKSLKEYGNDKEDIVSKYSQEGYDEIVNLLQFQIELYENELERQGIDIRNYEAGTDFDVIYQTPGKVVMTREKDKVGKVAQVDSGCYIYNDKVLRKAKVRLYKEEVLNKI